MTQLKPGEGLIGKLLIVKQKNGTEITGKCVSYIPAMDNTPEMESIWIQNAEYSATEIYTPNIASIQAVKQQ